MILGRVVGEVWATRRHPGLDGRKLVIVRPYLWYAPLAETAHLVAVDAVGANVGQDVVVCLGDGARSTLGAANLPVEAAVLGIVDRVDLATDVGRRPLTFVGGIAPAGSEAR
ncbi:MAG: ethanolamine utilization protein EutN [Myxococcales bacterium]|nr:ethanolamine utilization protein EutN [Myxococcales bacterium]